MEDMTVIQVNDRIRCVKEQLEKVKNDLAATKRLQTAYQQNSSLGNLEEADAGVAKLERQLFSVSDLLSKLEKHFESLGGAHALAHAQSSLEATNPYTNSNPVSSDPQQDPNRRTRLDASFCNLQLGQADYCLIYFRLLESKGLLSLLLIIKPAFTISTPSSSFNDSDSDLSNSAPTAPSNDAETASKSAYVGVATAKYDYEGSSSLLSLLNSFAYVFFK
ncbi:unnamed protein product [Dibothriocephalus latus]|uniref:Uncharacterized protein n=1 Tax=Dibothriocephalus latus TaxID=60516 RepID=A0A3P6TBZ1_DIBLA|nr:unnamed protein product [Dibothriocephalus latus]